MYNVEIKQTNIELSIENKESISLSIEDKIPTYEFTQNFIAGPKGADGAQGEPGPKGDGIDKVYYVRPVPVPITVGGISAGTTFNSTYEEVLDALLYPYINPAFNNFTISPSKVFEVGESTPNEIIFNWSTTSQQNIEIDSIEIIGVASQLPLSGSYTYQNEPISLQSDGVYSWNISGRNTKDVIFNKTASIRWSSRLYFGESDLADMTETTMKSLRVSSLSSNYSGNYSFIGGGYKYICYPAFSGTKTKFKDIETGLDVSMQNPYNISVTNQFGILQEYTVHRTTNKLGGAITIAVS